jgi:hypothetical protein
MYVASDYDDVYAVRFFFVYLVETMINHASINAISLRPVWVYNQLAGGLVSGQPLTRIACHKVY